MKRPRDDLGEETLTLEQAGTGGERRFLTRVAVLLLLATLGYLVWRIVTPLWQPLAWALLLGSLLAPFNLKLAARLGGRPRIASSVTLLLTVLLFILPVAAVAVPAPGAGSIAVAAPPASGPPPAAPAPAPSPAPARRRR